MNAALAIAVSAVFVVLALWHFRMALAPAAGESGAMPSVEGKPPQSKFSLNSSLWLCVSVVQHDVGSSAEPHMPKIDIAAVPARKGSGYPAPFDAPCADRTRRRLGDAGGLRDFGVNLMTLPPGGWSSQRHWHSDEDEFVYVLEGELKLVEDDGETLLRAGECAAFAKGTGNGHHLKNESSAVAVYLEVGSRNPNDLTTCSDVDMMSSNADGRFVHKDGTPYP